MQNPSRRFSGRRRLVVAMMSLASALPAAGCRICADCDERAYPAYGGSWERTRRSEGRVGSVFDPAGAKAPELVNRDVPPSPAELERASQTEEDEQPEDEFQLPGEQPSDDDESPQGDPPPADIDT